MTQMTIEVLLKLVDELKGPIKNDIEALEQFSAAGKQAGRADAALRPDKWVEEGRAIMGAAEQAKKFEVSALGAVEANAALRPDRWIEEGRAIMGAAEQAKSFETSALSAADAEKKISAAPWLTTAEDIDKATAALRAFNEQLDAMAGKKLPNPGGGQPGKGPKKGEPSPFWGMVENAGEMAALFEGPKAIETIVGGGAHLTDETIAQKIAGMSPQQIDDTRKLARDLQAKFPQFPLTEILKEAREARAIFTTDEEAAKALSIYLKMAALADRDHPGEGLTAAYPALRAVEEGGFTKDWAKTERALDDFQAAKNAMGAKLSFQDYFEVFQRGGAFARQWNDKFLRDELPHLLASLGGDATGVMIATLGEGIMGGHLMGPSLDALDKIGLIDRKKAEYKGGHIKRIEPGGVKGADILAHDPVEWAQNVLWPAIQKYTKDPDKQMQLLVTALSNRNELKAAYMSVTDLPQFERTKELIENPLNKGLDAADDLKADPTVHWQAVKSSTETLACVSSEPLMKGVAAGLNVLANGLSALSRVAGDRPVESSLASILTVAGILKGMGSAFGLVKNFFTHGGGEVVAETAGAGARMVGGRLLGPLGWALAAVDTFNDIIDDVKRLRRDLPPTPVGGGKSASIAGPEAIAAARVRAGLDPPPSIAPRPQPQVDTSDVERASAKAKQAHQDLQALGQTVKPKVDASTLDTLIAKLREAASLVGSINGGLSTASHRASFAGALHDGPEAR